MLVASLAAASSVASGYAHWVFFNGRNAPFIPVPAAFNVANLNNNTVSYFISDQAPGPLMPGDSFANIVSQIQAAANVWNQVGSSTIRLGFGGFSNAGNTPQVTPGVDVTFNDDIPPGLLAFTSLTFSNQSGAGQSGAPLSGQSQSGNGPFVPILRSTITLPRTLTAPNPLASYDDLFFLVTVHEFGHALGLQHTLTSGVMATQVTSATTKAAPLSPDDVAGISLLYPGQNFLQSTGTISGSVLVAGKGVNLANVVALSANGTAISALTNPDGSFLIQGVPPGQYYVYASPLPPAQPGESYPDNIIPPQDGQGNPFLANTGFDTEFYPSGRSLAQAGVVNVFAGQTSNGVSFNLQTRPGPAIGYLQTCTSGAYGGLVYSPSLYPGTWHMLLSGTGITTSSGLASGLSVAAIGAAAIQPKSLAFYGTGSCGLPGIADAEITVEAGASQGSTPVALVVTLPNDMYVLPYAFFVVPDAPPLITGVSGATDASGNTTVNLTGTNLSTASIVFDGVPAPASVNSDGSLTVTAPPAASGYTTYIEALSSDGQTSWQDLGNTVPPSYTYTTPQSPSIIVNSGLLLPGATALLDIIGVGTSFVPGQVSIGLGSSDISVGQVWVLNSQRVLANVTVNPQAQAGPVDLTVTAGLQTETIKGLLQVQTANPNQMTLLAPVLNQATGLGGTPAGGVALISTVGVPQNLTGWTLFIDGISVNFQMGGGNLITAQVPPNLPLPAATVQLVSPNANVVIPVVVMQIDAPDPQIVAVTNSAGALLNSSTGVHVGATVTLSVAGLTQSFTGTGLSNAQVTIGPIGSGVVITPLTILPGPVSDTYQIQFTLGSNVPFGPNQQLRVGIGTRISAPYNLLILP